MTWSTSSTETRPATPRTAASRAAWTGPVLSAGATFGLEDHDAIVRPPSDRSGWSARRNVPEVTVRKAAEMHDSWRMDKRHRGSSAPEPGGRAPDRSGGSSWRTDLTAVSDHAAERAIALAIEQGAELIVLSVVDPAGCACRAVASCAGSTRSEPTSRRRRRRSSLRARAAGVRATFLVWEGDPAETILSASESEGADVIVLGSHERGRLGRLVLGSISTRVSDEAHCQVLIVPREPATASG